MDAIKTFIAQGKTDQAIDALLQAARSHAPEKENDLILLSAQYANLIRKQNLQIIDEKEAGLQQNQINFTLLEMIGALKKELSAKPVAGEVPKEESVAEKDPKKIIFFAANPLDTPRINLDVESRELGRIFRNHPQKGAFLFQKEFGITLKLFHQVVMEDRPNIIQFSGFANKEGLYFHGADDQTNLVSNEALLTVFSLFIHPLECIFFNTWIARELAEALSANIPFVIGMNNVIIDQAAITFATGFYQALAYGKDYASAFAMGKTLMQLENFGDEIDKPFLINH